MYINRPSRLQTTYQRNLMIGMLTTIALVVIPCSAIIYFEDKGNVAVEVVSNSLIGAPTTFEFEAAGSNVGMVLPPGSPRSGFLGFVGGNVRIVSEWTAVTTAEFRSGVSAYDLSPEVGEPSLSATDGWGSGSFLSGGPPLSGYKPMSLNAEIIVTEEPEYPWVALEARKEGTVIFVLQIGKTGELAPFSVRALRTDRSAVNMEVYVDGTNDELLVLFLDEDPEGWFFRDKVEDVVFRWVFVPAVEEDVPVSRFVEVTYRFCLTDRCRKLAVGPVSR